MVQTGTLTALFHDLVQEAMEQQHIASSETTECYLVHMLERFAAPGRTDLLDPPLGVDYMRAFELPAVQRFDTLKRVADTALFVTGVFVDCLERSLVGSAATRTRSSRTRCAAAASAIHSSSWPTAFQTSSACSARSARSSSSRPSRTRSGSTSAGSRPAARARPTCSCAGGSSPCRRRRGGSRISRAPKANPAARSFGYPADDSTSAIASTPFVLRAIMIVNSDRRDVFHCRSTCRLIGSTMSRR